MKLSGQPLNEAQNPSLLSDLHPAAAEHEGGASAHLQNHHEASSLLLVSPL